MNASETTPAGYIQHHLRNWTSKEFDVVPIVDFSYVNWDTLFWSLLSGMIVCVVLSWVARRSHAGVPGRFQCAVEMIVEMVEENAKAVVHGDRTFVAPLGLTIFMWVSMMNLFDLLPLDLFPVLAKHLFGLEYMKVVPTADVNGALGIALGVFLLMFYYSFKIKGPGGFLHEMVSVPFGNHFLLWIPNFLLNFVEFFSKSISLGMRLFGNMYAGELLFMLIALLGATGSFLGVIAHIIAGTVWAIFHILIVFLQAFIFMMLALVYIGQAHEHH